MATTLLNNEPIYPGDSVFDICHGPGKVQAIECGAIIVSFGKGRPRKYNPQGMTGKSCYKSLYHRAPRIIEFPKDECRALKLGCALDEIMAIMAKLIDEPCIVQVPCCPEDDDTPACCANA